jgi:peptide/nickel transport system ATP-binding protein
VGGRVLLEGHNLLDRSDDAMRGLRGDRIAMIFQDPMMTLNPVLRIDTQMTETVLAHQSVSSERAHEIALNALGRVGIPSPAERMKAYPHQLSGGMRQRVAIAIALLNNPRVIVADEPTTALDVTIQAQIIFEVQKLARETGTAMVWITHDLSVIAGLADEVCVMYAGRIVESGPTADLLDHPLHPYTAGLIASIPSRNERGKPLAQIPGMTPSLLRLKPGCTFRDRCASATDECNAAPAITQPAPARTLRCFNPVTTATATR